MTSLRRCFFCARVSGAAGARPNNEASLRETLVRNELSIGDPAGPLLKGPVRRAIVPRRHRHRRPRNLEVKRGTVSPTQRLCRGAGKTDRSVRMARPPVCPASAGSLGGERNVRAKKMPAAVWARPASPESGKGSVAGPGTGFHTRASPRQTPTKPSPSWAALIVAFCLTPMMYDLGIREANVIVKFVLRILDWLRHKDLQSKIRNP